MKTTFSVLCHRYAAAHPHVKWSEVCKKVSAQLRPKKAVQQKAQQNRLPYAEN